eukprot:scaffold271178_cov31-Tisochrysis_lutea.AAC.1
MTRSPSAVSYRIRHAPAPSAPTAERSTAKLADGMPRATRGEAADESLATFPRFLPSQAQLFFRTTLSNILS